MGKNNGFRLVGKALLLAFFALFFIYPLASVFLAALSDNFSFAKLFSVIFSNSRLLWNSFSQALLSTIFAVLLGFPAGYLIARRDFPFKRALKAFSLVPFVFPSILVVLSFILVFGNNGWINSLLKSFFGEGAQVQFLYGFSGIILAHAFYNFPLIMRFVCSAWESTDVQMDEAAKTLGADRWRRFMNVTLPQLLPGLLAGATLVFIYCFMSFAIVLSLGSLKFSTFEVEIYRQVSRNLDFGLGAGLALFQFLLLATVSLLYVFCTRKLSIKHQQYPRPVRKLSPFSLAGAAESFFILCIVGFVLLPLLSLVVFAFADPSTGSFTLKAFEKIFFAPSGLFETTPLTSIFYSLLLATIASIIATVMGLLASLKQTRIGAVDLLLGASAAVSVITLGFGYYIGFGSGNLLVIAIGHCVLAFPFAYRAISNSLAKIDSESIDAAKTLGANDLEIFRHVQFPRIKGSLLVSMAFSFAVSLGELGLVLLLYDGVYATMPVYIYRLLSVFDIAAATAMGLILVFISFACFYVIERFSPGGAMS